MSGSGDLHRWTFKEYHEKLRAEARAVGLGELLGPEMVYAIFPDECVGKRKYRRMDRVIYKIQQKALTHLKEVGMRASTVEALVAGFMAELVDAKFREAGKDPVDWDWASLAASFKRSQTDPQYAEGKGVRPPLRRKLIDSTGMPLALIPTKEELEDADRTP